MRFPLSPITYTSPFMMQIYFLSVLWLKCRGVFAWLLTASQSVTMLMYIGVNAGLSQDILDWRSVWSPIPQVFTFNLLQIFFHTCYYHIIGCSYSFFFLDGYSGHTAAYTWVVSIQTKSKLPLTKCLPLLRGTYGVCHVFYDTTLWRSM
jgi:hypothetical protein